MAGEATLGYLAYRVLDQNTGAVVIANLPHLHQSTWQVNAMAQGMPGSAAIGSFSIPLPNVQSAEYKANKATYDLLAVGQKVEGYLGDVVAGTPRFTGIITNIEKSLIGQAGIGGVDTLQWLQKMQVIPGEYIPTTGPASSDVVSIYSHALRVGFNDACTSLANYSQTPASRWTVTSDPQTGASAFNCTTTGSESYLINTSAYLSSGITGLSSTIGNFYVVGGSDTANAGEASIVLGSDAAGANCVFASARLYSNAGVTTIDGEIWTRAAGVNTRQLLKTSILSNWGSSTLRVQVSLSCYYVGSLVWLHLFINGIDCGAYQYSNGGAFPTGYLGFRFNANAGGTPSTYAEELSLRYRDTSGYLFPPGTISSASVLWDNNTHLNNQTHLDMMSQAVTTEGWYLRKNPGAGYRADTLDFGAAPGVDRSSQVVFEEGDNLVDLTTSANADTYAIDTKVASTPSAGSGGFVTYPSIQATGNLALVDTVLNTGMVSMNALMRYANVVGALKATPGQAKRAVVIRDAKTADVWRELDYVTVHAPSLGIINQKVLVLGYAFAEGKATMDVVFDQYSYALGDYMTRRLADSARFVGSQYKTR